METTKPLARAGWLLAAALVILPIVDSAVPLLPLRLTDERWRWGFVGQFSNVTLVPLLGLLLALALAELTGAHRVKRVLGVISGILAVVLVIMTGFFIRDFFQVRSLVKPAMQHAMSVASTTALIKNVLSIISLALLSLAGFAGPTPAASPRQARTLDSSTIASPSPLLGVGRTRSPTV